MYEAHWGLRTKPFENTADAEFYYPGSSHQAALLKLRYAIENRRSGAVLTGAPGLGKSLLVHTLYRLLPETIHPRVHLVFPQMPTPQLLNYLACELSGESNGGGPGGVDESIRRIQTVLQSNVRAGQHAVVAIDEAQVLTDPHALETLRMLLNFETDATTSLTLLFVGQPTLIPAINRNPALEERLSVKCLLQPFDLDETTSYVTHRLRQAGAERSIFTDDAVDALQRLAHGIPRQINRLGDLALLVGFAEERDTIDAAAVEAVAEELMAASVE
jgi:general secretion pathway protein A